MDNLNKDLQIHFLKDALAILKNENFELKVKYSSLEKFALENQKLYVTEKHKHELCKRMFKSLNKSYNILYLGYWEKVKEITLFQLKISSFKSFINNL